MVPTPPDSGDKLASRWIGSAKVVAREGVSSYRIEVKPGYFMASPRGFLKAYTPDKFSDSPIQLFYHRRTPADPEGAPDGFILEEVLEHEEIGGECFSTSSGRVGRTPP